VIQAIPGGVVRVNATELDEGRVWGAVTRYGVFGENLYNQGGFTSLLSPIATPQLGAAARD
jgi:hypothetical protein